jgi:hypothetical protein
MNRIFKIMFAISFILTMPSIMVSAQDKKTEQKIRVIVNDGSGTRVIIDTVYKDSPAPDSVIIKDGTVVYINHPGDGRDLKDSSDEHVIYSDSESSAEKSRFVIARDGIVVTVEGNDEAKTKALVKEIENKMGVKDDAADKNETVKSESKKTIKK